MIDLECNAVRANRLGGLVPDREPHGNNSMTTTVHNSRLLHMTRAAWCAIALGIAAHESHSAVVVNEIFYKDASGDPMPSGDWFELANTAGTTVYLDGWVVTDKGGNAFTNFAGRQIAPYDFLVVCSDAAAFHAKHPAVTNYMGPSGISLGSNDAVLVDNTLGELEDEVEYECGADGWPYAYGTSNSLELVYPLEDNRLPCFWRLSTALNGSPGARNPNSMGISIPSHDRIPDGPKSGEPVLVRIQVNDLYGSVTSATIKVNWGDGVWIPGAMTLGTTNALIVLPATNNGTLVSYFFVVRDNAGQVLDHWWRGTNEPYLYIVDDTPRTNGLVINEIMYHSSNIWHGNGYEYLEIYNATSVPMIVSYWLVKDEIYNGIYDKLRLPGNLVLSGGWFLVLADRTQAVTDVYGPLPSNALMVELHDMDLDNGGQDIRWQNANGQTADDVDYNDKPPWPVQPDGNGPSLELIDPALDNSLWTSWAASLGFGTPGRPNDVPEPEVASWCLAAWLVLRSIVKRH